MTDRKIPSGEAQALEEREKGSGICNEAGGNALGHNLTAGCKAAETGHIFGRAWRIFITMTVNVFGHLWDPSSGVALPPPPNEENVSLQSSATSPCPAPPSEGRQMLFFTQGGAGRPRQRTGGSPGKSPSQCKGWLQEIGPPRDPPRPGTVQDTTPFRPSLRVARIYEPSGHPLRPSLKGGDPRFATTPTHWLSCYGSPIFATAM